MSEGVASSLPADLGAAPFTRSADTTHEVVVNKRLPIEWLDGRAIDHSLAMLPPSAYVTKDKAVELIRRCQAAIAAAQGRIG